MRTPQVDMAIFSERRKVLGSKIKGSAYIVAANPEYYRNNDVHHAYRQDSNMYYFTGFEEPNSVLVFRPGRTPETVMFVQPKDISQETWTGFRYGPDGVKKLFHIEQAFSIDQFEKELTALTKDCEQIFYSMFINREVDTILLKTIEQIAWTRSRSNKGNLAIVDPRTVIGEMRIRKGAHDIEMQKRACLASSEAHIEVMKAVKPGVNERALHGVFLRAIMERGCPREGYGSIVATGSGATTLHYVYNDQVCRSGEMLLIDAGGEYGYFSGDITRAYPVDGKYSAAQKRVYQKVLDVQKKLVTMVKPGMTREGIQKETVSAMTDIMIDEKLLRGRKEDLIEKREYAKFYPHNVSHWLGMDVHDAGVTEINGEPRPFEAGFVLTIEPGLYVPEDAPGVPEELRGLGIRIEDDILVTETGHENLTIKCPKEIADIEAIMK
jgi:Xaa-Pro aminopeptidase